MPFISDPLSCFQNLPLSCFQNLPFRQGLSALRQLLPLAFCGAGALWDLRKKRIPNRLIAAGLIVSALIACAQAYLGQSPEPIFRFFCGMLLPLLFPGILFLTGMMGAGDVKLFCLTGSFLGPARLAVCIAGSFFIGGCYAAWIMLFRKVFLFRIRLLLSYLREGISSGHWPPYRSVHAPGGQFCFSVPIFFGLLWAILREFPHR